MVKNIRIILGAAVIAFLLPFSLLAQTQAAFQVTANTTLAEINAHYGEENVVVGDDGKITVTTVTGKKAIIYMVGGKIVAAQLGNTYNIFDADAFRTSFNDNYLASQLASSTRTYSASVVITPSRLAATGPGSGAGTGAGAGGGIISPAQ